MARKIVVTSGKGGVGKTSVCANLGYSLAALGAKVLMLDIDIGLNNLDVVLGVENKIVYDIIDVLDGKCRPKQALIQDFFQSNLYVLPSNHTYYTDFQPNRIIEVINSLENEFDYILLDCPAGIENGFYRAIKCATEAIIVTTPHLSALRDGDKVISILNAYNITDIELIVNRARGDLMIDGEMLNVETIKEYLNVDILGVIPEDDEISKQLLTGGQLSRLSNAFNSFALIANKLHNGQDEIYDVTKKYKGLFGSVKRNLKKIL